MSNATTWDGVSVEVQEIAAKLCETEADMLLDFVGLEAGKVCAGAAMWECLGSLKGRRLMMRDFKPNGIEWSPTPLGLSVAQFIHAQRQARIQKVSGT